MVSNSSYEEVTLIKCTFIGRTVKTVARTSADSSIDQAMSITSVHNENHNGDSSKPRPPLESSRAEQSESTNKSSNEDIYTDSITGTCTVVENGDSNSPSSNEVILGTSMQESKHGRVNDEMLIESPLGQKRTN